MDDIGIAMAKLAGVRKGLKGALDSNGARWPPHEVAGWFTGVNRQLETLRASHSDLFGDIQDIPVEPKAVSAMEGVPTGDFHKGQLQHLARTIDEVFEIRANCKLTMPQAVEPSHPRRVFISHGRAQDWREVQSYIERDLGLSTMELAQEASGGKTIIEKLEQGAGLCDSAVIVMTGDDIGPDGEARARENVIHEIGYFHGRYGRPSVILLHEEGVSTPTNLSGIVYVAFPKGLVSATEGTLARELRLVYGSLGPKV